LAWTLAKGTLDLVGDIAAYIGSESYWIAQVKDVPPVAAFAAAGLKHSITNLYVLYRCSSPQDPGWGRISAWPH
jgi:hypothetical protein